MVEQSKEITKTLLLYHSGVGNTKFASYIIGDVLKRNSIDTFVNSVEEVDIDLLNKFDFIIIGFPTYHAEPSDTIKKFAYKLPFYESPKYVFLFTTCGLYSANSLHIMARILKKKNIFVVHYGAYRCPATDFSLIAPSFTPTLKFENHLKEKILKDTEKAIINFKQKRMNSPRFKLYSLLNVPNKILGKKFKRKIHINYSLCVGCKKCMENCPNKCFYKNSEDIVFKQDNCENCYRCIHHCPNGALSLNKRKPLVQFNEKFYRSFV